MTVYAQGSNVSTQGLPVVAPQDILAGHEYIWEYWCPAITFSFISPETLAGTVKGFLNLKEEIRKIDPTAADPPLVISGITIDTVTGNIWVRGVVTPVPTAGVVQQGVNPWAVAGLIGGVFAVIGAAVSLRFVYEVTGGGGVVPGGALDPCANPGITNYFKCLFQESKWFLFGFLFGIVALTVYLLVKFGPKGRA